MGKIIAVLVIVFLGFAWYKGWIQDWIGRAADSGADAVTQTRGDARKVRPIDGAEKKKE